MSPYLYPKIFCLALHFSTKQSLVEVYELALLQVMTSGMVRWLGEGKGGILANRSSLCVPHFLKMLYFLYCPSAKGQPWCRFRMLLFQHFSIIFNLEKNKYRFCIDLEHYKRMQEENQVYTIIFMYWLDERKKWFRCFTQNKKKMKLQIKEERLFWILGCFLIYLCLELWVTYI